MNSMGESTSRDDNVAAQDQDDVCEKHGLPFTEHKCLVLRPVTRQDASFVADAMWRCQEARQEERQARDEASQPDSWDYFGHRYFEAIERADQELADALNRSLGSDRG